MRYLTLCILSLGLLMFPLAQPAAAAPFHPSWKLCVLHYGPRGGFHDKECHRYVLAKETRHPIGHTWHRVRVSRSTEDHITWPLFYHPAPVAPSGRVMWFPVTGYSWGCGTPNGVTASGTVPGVGTVASNSLPIGVHVYVPSLGYSGTVLDRGAPLDLFASSCAATYAYTGYREVIVS